VAVEADFGEDDPDRTGRRFGGAQMIAFSV
jgi:hypothetical protein